MTPRPYVVDGHNLCMRSVMQAALDDLKAGSTYTGGLYSALRSLRRIVGFPGFSMSRTIICFDCGRPAWRRELVPEYKANRAARRSQIPEEELKKAFQQVDLFREAVALLGATVVWFKHREADDGIAAVCRLLEGQRPIVVSGDKDLLQLVDDRVSVWMLRNRADLMVNMGSIHSVMPVDRRLYLLFRGLVGDTSDGIPGLDGLGEQRALSVVEQVTTAVPGILEQDPYAQAATLVEWAAKAVASTRKPPKFMQTLKDGLEPLCRFIQVMDLSDSWGDTTGLAARLAAPHPMQKGAFLTFCRQYRFASILQDLGNFLRPFSQAERGNHARSTDG